MKASYKLENTKDVMATLTVTMAIAEWEEIALELSAKWPAWKLASIIKGMIRVANKEYGEVYDAN